MDGGLGTWVPPTLLQDSAGVSGSWLQPSPTLDITGIWKVKHWMKDLLFSLPPTLHAFLSLLVALLNQ